jgi:MoxR-like ATPase
VLLEGVPGLGKTTLLRTLARTLQLKYSRIQFTPDLMPADIVGSMIMESDDRGGKTLRFQYGPIFANLVLADEINRATPKTQSALLEAMQERTVTSGTTTHELEPPFLVMATQNPIEMEGTYPLPEAQLDRFLMKILVTYPSREELSRIVERTIARDEEAPVPVMNREEIHQVRQVCRQVLVAPHVQEYAIQLVMATQSDHKEAHEMARKYIRYGSSPRGAQALVECGRVHALMRGRFHLAVEDILHVAAAVLRHRIILNFDAHADGQTPETILQAILKGVSAQTSAA